ncbi:VOC family protein [Yoonia sediminilitoris]|uniref:Glyoxalase-like protein n=1 Tax=Yoonia sediminilitoris TaxID=1286148 RepID=A0A2T6KQ61_9RHOB|nr:VOC family protein [Yoonia sediminilitoris]PUB18675.1 glyoxalase-like protein [Yoonia sediminilitoris]RCW98843.1 glyoxalase-like protein [Yoonia sediminilitoris]
MMILDHLAVAAETLDEGVQYVEDALGVSMQPGGKHPRYGTHNMLLGLGDIYLEVIAPDPDAAPFDGPRWFGLDRFSGPPRLANWICKTDFFEPIAGPPVALTRGNLSWRITVPADGSLPYGGAFPTQIKWAPGTHHPASRLSDSGCSLIGLTVSHPDRGLAGLVETDDPRLEQTVGPLGLSARIQTPKGVRILS